MHRKGAQDAKRAKQFTKIVREITVAAKTGIADPNMNPRLRSALIAARAANMPKDRVDAAIKKATGAGDADNYEEIRYEGYGVSGVAVIVEALTDNRNRTAAEIRSAFTKVGGNLGETGSVSFMFNRLGQIIYPSDKADENAILEAAIELGADNCESDSDSHEITCQIENFNEVRDGLITKFGDPESAKIAWIASTTTPVSEEQAVSMFKLIDILEDNDDVQAVYTNLEVSDEIMTKISA